MLGGLLLISRQSYLLFHTVAELLCVVIGCATFLIAWNSRQFLRQGYLLLLGIAALFVAIIDLVHTLAFKGMTVLPSEGANLATQLWIAARYTESISLLIAPLFLHRRLRPWVAIWAYAAAITLLLCSIFTAKLFPECFVEGSGLTRFKIVSEYVICAILAAAIALLLRRRAALDPEVLRWLVWSMVWGIGSELTFTAYVSVVGGANLAGHYLKIISAYCVYRAVIQTGLAQPFAMLLREVKQSEGMLARELSVAQRLQQVSTQLIHADKIELLYDGILDTAVAILHADCARLQILKSALEPTGDLQLLVERDLRHPTPDNWMPPPENALAKIVAATKKRVIVPDVDQSPLLANSPEPSNYAQAGIRAVQKTPLLSRTGALLGIISTHWRVPHEPAPIELGALDVLARQAADLIDRDRSEQALRASEHLFRTLADSIPNLAFWANADGNPIWFNQRWYEFVGELPADSPPANWERFLDPAALLDVRSRWSQAITKGLSFELEHALRSSTGTYRWFLTRTVPLKDSEGKVVRWFGTSTDVTELREAREVLGRSKEELERLVQERTAKLNDAIGELEHLSYTITHDMRAPLRAMRGFAQAVQELCAGNQDPELALYLKHIMTAAERMDLLITDALHYTRAVRQELPLGPVPLGDLLRGMVSTYPEFMPDKAAIALQEPLPTVMGNEAALTQCFSNLLSNAVKFVRPGEKPTVRIFAEPAKPCDKPARAEEIKIWVEDNGIGITPNMMPKLFLMFSRGSRDYEGTGIGLALVRKVVQRMGGRVGAESDVGKGSRFWVELQTAGPALDRSAAQKQ